MLYQIIALLIWSSSFVAAKYAYTLLDPVLTVQARLIIAGLIILPTSFPLLKLVPRHEWKTLLWLSFANYVAVLLLQFIGLKYTSAASAVTLIGLEPLLMVFVGHYFFGDKAAPFHWICGAVAFVGVALLMFGGHGEGSPKTIDPFGCLLVLLAGIVFCFTLRPTQAMIKRIGAHVYTQTSLLLAAPLCLPFTLMLTENYAIHWDWRGFWALLYLAVACSWLAYWLWNQGMNQVPANLMGLLTALEPIFGVILAVILLREPTSALSWLGIALVIMATTSAAFLERQRKT
ncbi:MAG: DMT family transporter [Cardiobacteriaceae bacterium]|nr:DMT family transporter [Cardiobacteriaceae bacterium]